MKLYHREIGFPSEFKAPEGRVDLRYTDHALRSGEMRKIRMPKSVTLSRMQIIEIGVEGNKVMKMLLRGRLDDSNDICIVVIPSSKAYIVKTVWVNSTTDLHTTLDASKYQKV